MNHRSLRVLPAYTQITFFFFPNNNIYNPLHSSKTTTEGKERRRKDLLHAPAEQTTCLQGITRRRRSRIGHKKRRTRKNITWPPARVIPRGATHARRMSASRRRRKAGARGWGGTGWRWAAGCGYRICGARRTGWRIGWTARRSTDFLSPRD